MLIAWNYTRSPVFMKRFDESVRQLDEGIARLKVLTAGNARQNERARRLERYERQVVSMMTKHQQASRRGSLF